MGARISKRKAQLISLSLSIHLDRIFTGRCPQQGRYAGMSRLSSPLPTPQSPESPFELPVRTPQIQLEFEPQSTFWRHLGFQNIEGMLEANAAALSEQSSLAGQGSASVLLAPVRINLNQTPVISWEWNISDAKHAEWPMALYIGVESTSPRSEGLLSRWMAEASAFNGFEIPPSGVLYTYGDRTPPTIAKRGPLGLVDIAVINLRSSDARPGELLRESRNVQRDFERVFGWKPENCIALALVVDARQASQPLLASIANVEAHTDDQTAWTQYDLKVGPSAIDGPIHIVLLLVSAIVCCVTWRWLWRHRRQAPSL